MSIGSHDLSPFRRFSASEWESLRKGVSLDLNEEELSQLRGLGETVDLREVEQIYLPLSRLLNLYVEGKQSLFGATNAFLGSEQKVPFIIGIGGSVAVGKSTTSRILRHLLARWPNHPKVDLVTTDGFLYPNATLLEHNLMDRKGFPESFNTDLLRAFLNDVKSGHKTVDAPIYSHLAYDILPNETVSVSQPDILIVEGLNVLQPARLQEDSDDIPFVSDYFDFSIFIDADRDDVQQWYIDRFLSLKDTAFRKPGAYFQRYADLTKEQAIETATDIWTRINLKNLIENIQPTRGRADLILHKAKNHSIDQVLLRKI